MLFCDGVLSGRDGFRGGRVRFWRRDRDLGVALARGVAAQGGAGTGRGTRGVREGERQALALSHATATVLKDIVW